MSPTPLSPSHRTLGPSQERSDRPRRRPQVQGAGGAPGGLQGGGGDQREQAAQGGLQDRARGAGRAGGEASLGHGDDSPWRIAPPASHLLARLLHAQATERVGKSDESEGQGEGTSGRNAVESQGGGGGERQEEGEGEGEGDDGIIITGGEVRDPFAGMNPRERKLAELKQKALQSRRANQKAVVDEHRRLQVSGEGQASPVSSVP